MTEIQVNLEDTLINGKFTYKLQVPYRLVSVGSSSKKPLLVYLHGYGQNISVFETAMKRMLEIEAYHLFIQAPLPEKVTTIDQDNNGYAWYYFEEGKGPLLKSMEYSSEFVQEIIDHVISLVEVSRIGLIGYSMGAYFGGYWACSRWKHVHEVILMNGRLKTELFEERITQSEELKHLNLLAIHGQKDEIVRPEPQQKALEFTQSNGINSQFILLNAGHKLTRGFTKTAIEWLCELGYRKI